MSKTVENSKQTQKNFDLGELTDPKEYIPGQPYRFLVHVALNPHDKLSPLLVGTGKKFQTEDDEVVSTSLIDQENPWVFEAGAAFILDEVKGEDVMATYSTDTGLSRPHKELQYSHGDEVLGATEQLDYNQITIKGGTVKGILIRIDATTGKRLGNERVNQQLLDIAKEYNLPVAEIPVDEVELTPGPAKVKIQQGVDSAGLLQLLKPAEHRLLKLDIARVPEGSPLDYFGDNPGFMARCRIIDGHGQVLENDSQGLSTANKQLLKNALSEIAANLEANNYIELARGLIDEWAQEDQLKRHA